jgi:hypothetical protein
MISPRKDYAYTRRDEDAYQHDEENGQGNRPWCPGNRVRLRVELVADLRREVDLVDALQDAVEVLPDHWLMPARHLLTETSALTGTPNGDSCSPLAQERQQ